MSERETLTYSALSTFRDCRRRAWYRYEEQIVPITQHVRPLYFGNAIHNLLEIHHQNGPAVEIIDHTGELERSDQLLAAAMMDGYQRTYATEDWEVLELEQKFEAQITNPDTGAASRTFVMAGKRDGVVRKGQGVYLLEHKTTSRIDQAYLEKLWMDFQITLYSHYYEVEKGVRIDGVIYNILAKAQIKQREGETLEAFEARRAELVAKSKTGKSTAKQQLPESDEEFALRLAAKYQEPGMFHREMIILDRDHVLGIQAQVWELTQAWLAARRGGIRSFYQNTSDCFKYGRPCAYFALCRSGDSSNVKDNLYENKPAHEELTNTSSPVDELPF